MTFDNGTEAPRSRWRYLGGGTWELLANPGPDQVVGDWWVAPTYDQAKLFKPGLVTPPAGATPPRVIQVTAETAAIIRHQIGQAALDRALASRDGITAALAKLAADDQARKLRAAALAAHQEAQARQAQEAVASALFTAAASRTSPAAVQSWANRALVLAVQAVYLSEECTAMACRYCSGWADRWARRECQCALQGCLCPTLPKLPGGGQA